MFREGSDFFLVVQEQNGDVIVAGGFREKLRGKPQRVLTVGCVRLSPVQRAALIVELLGGATVLLRRTEQEVERL